MCCLVVFLIVFAVFLFKQSSDCDSHCPCSGLLPSLNWASLKCISHMVPVFQELRILLVQKQVRGHDSQSSSSQNCMADIWHYLEKLFEKYWSQMLFQYILISRASMGPTYMNLLWKDEAGEAIDREGKATSWSHLHDFGPDSGTVRRQWSVLSRGVDGWDFTTVERMYGSRGDRRQEGQWPGCCCLQVRHDWPKGGCDGNWDGEKWLD